MIEILDMHPKCLTLCNFIVNDLTNENIKRLTLNPSDPSQNLAPDLISITVSSFPTVPTLREYPSGALLTDMILSRWADTPDAVFEINVRYTGPNLLSDSRIVRQIQQGPGSLAFNLDPMVSWE